MVWFPAVMEVVAMLVAIPPDNVTGEPRFTASMANCTVAVAMALAAVTVAVKVTEPPRAEGLEDDASAVVVLTSAVPPKYATPRSAYEKLFHGPFALPDPVGLVFAVSPGSGSLIRKTPAVASLVASGFAMRTVTRLSARMRASRRFTRSVKVTVAIAHTPPFPAQSSVGCSGNSVGASKPYRSPTSLKL